MCALKLGSLFDGIGVFPLAASRNGIIPVWASEIEKSPIAITKRHFPDMEHLGDITKIHGGNIPPVHIITFGSPCQNLSKIGKREGLAGSKSGLFFQAIRIIEEMRCATNGLYPVIAVWENVMGAFSSNDRMDFRAVLQSFSDTEISMPPTGGWANAGMVRGGKTDLCWRLMDAQYWGKPRLVQRRKRIFLVADFRGQRSAEILFKPRDMFPIPPPCTDYGLPAAGASRISLDKTRGKIPVIRPFQERRMRSAAKSGNQSAFLASFGRPDEPFPTLLAKAVNMISFWYEGEEKDGVLRNLTPVECERLMGLPEGWTAYGNLGQPISDNARCKALGNAIALPCADYIMAGIADHIESFTDYDFAHLLFSDGDVTQSISLEKQLNIIQVADLVLPDKETSFEEYTTMELLSVAMLIVISTFALDFIHTDRSVFKIVDLDEAWSFLQVAQGKTLSMKLVRAGRAMNAGVYFVTQNTDDLLDEKLKNNLGLKFAFRSTDINEIKKTLAFFGVDSEDENNQKRLHDLENGQCLISDLYGRVGVIQFHPIFEDLFHAFDTRPPVRKEVEE